MAGAFLTQKGTPSVNLQKAAAKQGCAALFEAVVLRLDEALTADEMQQATAFNNNALAVFKSFDEAVENLKKTAGDMTFDDLELRVLEMLSKEKIYSALSHRLYAKYRHVLIDEFQDTSPIQWRIIRRWLLDSHGNDEQPTVFIVGDAKQAIYGFRHGDARLLEHAADFLQQHYGAPPPLRHDTCYRCGGNILEVVNRTFANCPLMPNFVAHQHGVATAAKRGRVEWHHYCRPSRSVTQKPDAAIRNPLLQPLPTGDDMQALRARAVATKVREILNTWQLHDDKGVPRACRAEDILILLPAFTHAETQTDALSEMDIDCAAGGRADFLESFECGDILDLIALLLSPLQSYPLARVLKSPLFGIDDAELAALAARQGATLWEKLQQKNGGGELRRARILLRRWQRQAQCSLLPAHDFLAALYRQSDVTARYRAAVMPSLRRRVTDNLLRLLDLSLLMDGGKRPLLAQFLEDARAGRCEAMPAATLGVRLMTIHAAKGLESQIVILADASFPDIQSRGGSVDILSDWPPGKAAPADFAAIPRRYARAASKLRIRTREKYQREQANQLYVAMTRARQALIIFAPETCKQPTTWAQQAMQEVCEKNGTASQSSLYCYGESFVASVAPPDTIETDAAPPPLPVPLIGIRQDASAAAVRGENRHRILALLLSGVSLSQAQRLLAAEPAQWREAELMFRSPPLQSLLNAAQQILAEREFALNGEIIRPDLVVASESEVWIVDYKTGNASPEQHLPQLQKYAQAVSPHYPGRTCRLAILDIRGQLHELPMA